MNIPVGIRAIGISFPKTIRTNDYWKEHYPELIAQAEQKSLARAFSPVASSNSNEVDLWTQEMLPYLSDPFRGIVERRVLGTGESSLTLEYQAADNALKSAEIVPEEIDLMLVASLFPEQIVPGNAAFLAGKLGLTGAAWNLESTCTSAIVAFQTACAMVRAGEYKNVLVVLSTTFSRYVDENDTFSFLMGDGAAAFVVSQLTSNRGVLSTKIIHTSDSCDSFFNELTIDAQGNPRMFIRVGKNASKMLRNLFVKSCRQCCFEAVAAAGITMDQIDFFVSNTNTAWYSSVYTQALGIDPNRTINLNSKYANIGAASPIVNLYHAAQLGKIREGDLVLLYTFGGTSTAGATIMRWDKVALGFPPESAANLTDMAEYALR